MLDVVYGLTRDNEKEYEILLSKVETLPTIVNYEPLARAMKADGVGCKDALDPYSPIETSPAIDDEFTDRVSSFLRGGNEVSGRVAKALKSSLKVLRKVAFYGLSVEESSSDESSSLLFSNFDN
jgi:hypothetical protein